MTQNIETEAIARDLEFLIDAMTYVVAWLAVQSLKCFVILRKDGGCEVKWYNYIQGGYGFFFCNPKRWLQKCTVNESICIYDIM